MGGIPSFLRALAIPVLIGFLASGCAAGRSVIDVNVPEATAPESGPAVKIVDVRDLRQFEVNPADPSKPSIGDAKELQDSKITSHAIGRKRGGYGNAMGDLALPENKTAASVVREAVRTALLRRGYRVVDESAPEYSTALPVSIGVQQFWAWMKPGFIELTLSLESQVTLSGNELIGRDPVVVVGHYSTGTGAAFEKTWAAMIQSGVEELIGKIEQKIRSPSEIAVSGSGPSGLAERMAANGGS
jgi:hypothetical protein